jgi:hypothetical protein
VLSGCRHRARRLQRRTGDEALHPNAVHDASCPGDV